MAKKSTMDTYDFFPSFPLSSFLFPLFADLMNGFSSPEPREPVGQDTRMGPIRCTIEYGSWPVNPNCCASSIGKFRFPHNFQE